MDNYQSLKVLTACLIMVSTVFIGASVNALQITHPASQRDPGLAGDKFAVIVVGADPPEEKLPNGEWMHIPFEYAGQRVYDALIDLGYLDQNIYYLSWNENFPHWDEHAYVNNVEYYLTEVLRDRLDNGLKNEEVTLYFIDHGAWYGTNPYYWFRTEDTKDMAGFDDGFITQDNFSKWINLALKDSNGFQNYRTATIVFETCYSELMLRPFLNLAGNGRTLIAASLKGEQAYSWWKEFASRAPADYAGPIFTYFFTNALTDGLSVKDAFDRAAVETTFEVIECDKLTVGPYQHEEQHPVIHQGFYINPIDPQ